MTKVYLTSNFLFKIPPKCWRFFYKSLKKRKCSFKIKVKKNLSKKNKHTEQKNHFYTRFTSQRASFCHCINTATQSSKPKHFFQSNIFITGQMSSNHLH